jgi:hypothetical protein
MGNAPSNNAMSDAIRAAQAKAAAAPPPPPPPPLNTEQQCAVRKVELNQIRNDMNNKQNDVDTCDPQGAQARKTQEAVAENQRFVNQKTAELEKATSECNRQITIARQIAEATEPLDEYDTALKQELESLNKENEQLERRERAHRRSFVDNEPQSGVGGVPAIRTQDDKVLFAFWICYGAALISVMILLTKMFEAQIGGTKEKILVSLGAILAAYGLAYYIIAFYG